jgi:hypothetical protein
LIGVDVHGFVGDDGPALGESVHALTATEFRSLPLDHVAGIVLEKIKRTQEAFNVGPSDPDGITGRRAQGGRTGRPPLTTEDLAEVAAIYRAGGTTPTKAVADALNISRSAAAKRVVRARGAGLLEGTKQGQRGGPARGTTGSRAKKEREQ